MPQDNGKYCQAYVSEDCVTVKDGKLEMRILTARTARRTQRTSRLRQNSLCRE
ncbi:MAG: hypothetical protein ACLR56_07310 [Oscillospiraceae bacterium]